MATGTHLEGGTTALRGRACLQVGTGAARVAASRCPVRLGRVLGARWVSLVGPGQAQLATQPPQAGGLGSW